MTTNKKIALILGTIVILVVGGSALAQHMKNQRYSSYNSTSNDNQTTSINTSTTTQTSTTGSVTSTSTTTKAPDTYTLAQVAKHSKASSCWTTINGGVYDVTSWIDQHPGGQQAIIGLCGIDGSDAFNGQHGGQRRPASELASFKIGTLAK